MTKPVPDKAESTLEYPDTLNIGTFERSSRAAAFPALALAFSLAATQFGTAQTLSEPRFLMACVPCHGFDGIGNDGSTPNLAGQGREYLYNQLMAFRAGQRKHPVMNFFSIQTTREELAQIVDYYSALPRR